MSLSEATDLSAPPTVRTLDRVHLCNLIHTAFLLIPWVVAVDIGVYRGGGWTGWAMVLIGAMLMVMLAPRTNSMRNAGTSCYAMLVTFACWKLIWNGSSAALASAIISMTGLLLTSNGLKSYVTRWLLMPFRIFIGTIDFLVGSIRIANAAKKPNALLISRSGFASVLLPAGALLVFGGLFVLANPNFRDIVWNWQSYFSDRFWEWIFRWDGSELLVAVVASFIGLGCMFPYISDLVDRDSMPPRLFEQQERSTEYFQAARNTLWIVVLLFASYLGYEFFTMWQRSFPKGFYYAGYAHEGAFWLTMALGLATVVLSLLFARSMTADPRMKSLRWLAYLWSFENLLLAACVYNRLLIYVDFNGMTRMRVIGFVGITTVVIGFVWVIVKIRRDQGMSWLIQRHMWTLATSIMLYAILPVDWLVHRYNANEVLGGNYAPSVQMVVHPSEPDGLLAMERLIDCENSDIREGVRALLADWLSKYDLRASERKNWSHYQIAEQTLYQKLTKHSEKLKPYSLSVARKNHIQLFYNYAYQWY